MCASTGSRSAPRRDLLLEQRWFSAIVRAWTGASFEATIRSAFCGSRSRNARYGARRRDVAHAARERVDDAVGAAAARLAHARRCVSSTMRRDHLAGQQLRVPGPAIGGRAGDAELGGELLEAQALAGQEAAARERGEIAPRSRPDAGPKALAVVSFSGKVGPRRNLLLTGETLLLKVSLETNIKFVS